MVRKYGYIEGSTDNPVPRLEGKTSIEPSGRCFDKDGPWERKSLLALDGGEVLALSSSLFSKVS